MKGRTARLAVVTALATGLSTAGAAFGQDTWTAPMSPRTFSTPGAVLSQDIRAGIEQLAANIVKEAPEGRQLRVAVADFPDLQGVTSALGRYIASRLTTRLAQSPKFFVIERQRLGQILAELKFGMSDLVDPAKVKQLGRMVGVEAVVVGTVADLGNQVDIDARMIEIETTHMLLGVTATLGKDPVVTQMLERGRQAAILTEPPSPASAPKSRPGSPTSSKAVSVNGFTFEARGCQRSGGEIVCTVAFVNAGAEQKQLRVQATCGGSSRIVDFRGNQYAVTRVAIGPRWGDCWIQETFLPQLPVNVRFIAKDVSDEATALNLIIVIEGFNRSLLLRDIPIGR